MPARRKVARRTGGKRRVRRHQGEGLFDAFKSAHNWIKSNKIISTVGNALAPVIPIAGTIGNVAAAAGYGRNKGGAWGNWLSQGHNFIKSNQLISKGLSHFGHPKLAGIARAAGYGRRSGGGMLTYFTTDQPSAVRFS